MQSYQLWALVGALFAGLTALWGKKGIEEVPPNLGIAVRVAVIFPLTWIIAAATKQTNISSLKSDALLYLSLSGIATGASWFCYYRALQLGPISRVAPIDKASFLVAALLGVLFLRERPSPTAILGIILIAVGLMLTLKK